jgi:hypothetical protein
VVRVLFVFSSVGRDVRRVDESDRVRDVFSVPTGRDDRADLLAEQAAKTNAAADAIATARLTLRASPRKCGITPSRSSLGVNEG